MKYGLLHMLARLDRFCVLTLSIIFYICYMKVSRIVLSVVVGFTLFFTVTLLSEIDNLQNVLC